MLSAIVVLAATPSSVSSAACGSARGADGWAAKTMSATGVMARFGPLMTELWSGYRQHHAWCEGHLLLPGWHVLWWGLWKRHCRQMLHGLGKVPETLACPKHQTPAFALPWSTVAKHRDQTWRTCNGSATMTVPWSAGSVAPNPGLPSVTEFQYFVMEITLLLLKFSWNFGQNTEICLNFSVVSAQKYWTLCKIFQKYWN